jgi:hypothetical protein
MSNRRGAGCDARPALFGDPKGTSTNKEALVVHGRGIPDRLLLAGKPSAKMRETGYAALLGFLG